jgi:cell wall-associated NlpC family hydrolase
MKYMGMIMMRSLISVWSLSFILLITTAGCAAPLREMKGITRLGYTIQVGAFAEVKNAERLTVKLQGKGIEAFYFKKDNGVYAVRFGDYPNRDAAAKAARKLVAEKLIGSYFIASPRETYLVKPKEPVLRGEERRPASKPKAGPDMGAIAARTAERFVGIPYQWGGNNVVEGMDCSGFARAVYNLCGVNIPRTSGEQFRTGESVDRQNLRDGDLVFFGVSESQINHVGIYVGNGRFVHAPRRGDDIKTSSLDEPYFSRKFVGGRRYF